MAIREELSVVIERPVEEVFAFATDPENEPLWLSVPKRGPGSAEVTEVGRSVPLKGGGAGAQVPGRRKPLLGTRTIEIRKCPFGS
jgi:uncharacterized protein YndB with AHSA1/START domain